MKNTLLLGLSLVSASSLGASAQDVRASALLRLPGSLQPVAAPYRGGGPEYGSVRRVLDADTYEVLIPAGLVRVRLSGVDAPENSQPFGKQAADSVARLLRGRVLEVRRGEPDRYGRNLAVLRVAVATAGTVRWLRVDSVAVARGWAWAYEPGGAVPRWAMLQQTAQNKRLGLWKCGAASVIRPGVWRAFNKMEKLAYWGGCFW